MAKYVAESERLGLQPLSMDHLEGYHASASDERMARFLLVQRPFSLKE